MDAVNEYLQVANFIVNLVLIPAAVWVLKVEKQLTAIQTKLDIERELIGARRRVSDFDEKRG